MVTADTSHKKKDFFQKSIRGPGCFGTKAHNKPQKLFLQPHSRPLHRGNKPAISARLSPTLTPTFLDRRDSPAQGEKKQQ